MVGICCWTLARKIQAKAMAMGGGQRVRMRRSGRTLGLVSLLRLARRMARLLRHETLRLR